MKKNSNLLNADSKTYKTNLLLEFQNVRIETSYSEDYSSRQHYSLVCYQIFGILQSVYYFFAKACNSDSMGSRCTYKPLLLLTVILDCFLIWVLSHSKLKLRRSPNLLRGVMMISSLYFHISALERFETLSGWALILLHMYVTNSFCFAQWRRHMLSFMGNIAFIFLFAWYYDKLIHRELRENIGSLALAMILLVFYAANQERFSKENWVILDSFRKSERFLEKFIDESGNALIIVDQARNILLCNLLAREFMRNATGDKYRKQFSGSLLANFEDSIVEKLNSSIDQCFESGDRIISTVIYMPEGQVI
jgi:hypothetical protein